MIDYVLSIIEKYSSRINVWCWNKRWKNREEGTGYRGSWIKGYKKWKRNK